MNVSPDMARLCAITPLRPANGMKAEDAVRAAIRGGATMVQLRDKEASDDDIVRAARELAEICAQCGVPLVINDRPDLAMIAGASGAHVGQSDMPAAEARALMGPAMILGVSAGTIDEALAAERDGADLIGTGAIFSTKTKEDADLVAIEAIKMIASRTSIPVIAIGGLRPDNLKVLRGTGISGIAAASAAFSSPDPEIACRELIEKMREIDII